jgi:hypothetical protein
MAIFLCVLARRAFLATVPCILFLLRASCDTGGHPALQHESFNNTTLLNFLKRGVCERVRVAQTLVPRTLLLTASSSFQCVVFECDVMSESIVLGQTCEPPPHLGLDQRDLQYVRGPYARSAILRLHNRHEGIATSAKVQLAS